MITNQRQYRITKAQAEKFAKALKALESDTTDIHPRLRTAQIDAIKSQLEELNEELKEYEALRAKKQKALNKALRVQSLEDLPQALIGARIAVGLTQKKLAERLGMKEQQIQRYEATGYASANLTKLLAIVHALGVNVQGNIRLPE